MSGKRSVLVIGLDGMTFDLLNPLMDIGLMPVFQNLVRTGSAGILESSIPPVSAPAWVSFQTGVNPGKHGIVDFFRYQAGSYEPTLVSPRVIKTPTVWDLLSAQGRRVCVLNVPVTYPPWPVNGYMISGFMTPGVDTAFTYPADLRERLLAQVPDYVIAPQGDIATDGVSGFIKKMLHTIQKRWQAARWLLDLESWDLFMVQFQATDVLQHALWDCLDSTQAGYARYSEAERRLAHQFYHILDEIIGDLIQRAGDTSVIIMSDHGFGPARKRVYLNRWLANQKYLALTGNARMQMQSGIEDMIKRLDFMGLRHRLFPKGVGSVRAKMIRKLTQNPWIDWAHTRAHVPFGTTYASLYINRVDREAQGCVPESAYELLRDELIERLPTLTDPSTGQPVVEKVYRREEIFTGPAVLDLPDLLVRPYGGYLLETRFKGTRLFDSLPAHLSGLHRMEGLYVLSGGALGNHRHEGRAHITDLAPTILQLLDVPVPQWMDGQGLLTSLLSELPDSLSFMSTHPSPNLLPGQKEETEAYSSEEASKVVERLHDLGYL